LRNKTLEFKCDFKKGFIPLREAAEQLTKIVIGDLCFAIGPCFFCEGNEKTRIHTDMEVITCPYSSESDQSGCAI
jgi:hypothetical protein